MPPNPHALADAALARARAARARYGAACPGCGAYATGSAGAILDEAEELETCDACGRMRGPEGRTLAGTVIVVHHGPAKTIRIPEED